MQGLGLGKAEGSDALKAAFSTGRKFLKQFPINQAMQSLLWYSVCDVRIFSSFSMFLAKVIFTTIWFSKPKYSLL